MERNSNNYQRVREEWRGRFLAMDCEKLAERFHLDIDKNNLYLTYFSVPFAICRQDAKIIRLDQPEMEIGFNQEMNFFNIFHYAIENPVPSGELVPFRNVKRVYPFEAAYVRTILKPFAKCFSGHLPELRHAFEVLKAQPSEQGDAGGILDILPGLRMAVTFWDQDDEFEAQANMLFDSNITDFMHEENVVSVASDAASFLAQASGLDNPEHLL